MKKKENKLGRLPKILKIVGGVVAAYVLLFYLLIGPLFWALTYPNVSKAKYYEPLANWNLPTHLADDLDHDGQTDIIFFQGCAVLTARSEATIPEDKQCRFSIYGRLSEGLPQGRTIGEKYSDFNEVEMGWKTGPIHAYMFKQDNSSNWNIVAFSTGKLTQYEISSDGSLVKKTPSVSLWINEMMYLPGHAFAMLAVKPLIMVGWLLFAHVPIILSLVAAWSLGFLVYFNFRKKILSYFSKK